MNRFSHRRTGWHPLCFSEGEEGKWVPPPGSAQYEKRCRVLSSEAGGLCPFTWSDSDRQPGHLSPEVIGPHLPAPRAVGEPASGPEASGYTYFEYTLADTAPRSRAHPTCCAGEFPQVSGGQSLRLSRQPPGEGSDCDPLLQGGKLGLSRVLATPALAVRFSDPEYGGHFVRE